MDNILFEDITVDGVDVAVTVDMGYKPGPIGNATDPGTPRLGIDTAKFATRSVYFRPSFLWTRVPGSLSYSARTVMYHLS